MKKPHFSKQIGTIKPHTSWLMLAPFTLLFIVFTIIPILAAVGLSFTDFNMVQFPRFVFFENYERLFLDDEIFIISLKNTLIFAFLTGPVGYLLSFIFAWLINEFNPKLRSLLTLVFYSPTLAGNVYFVWLYIFSGDPNGMVNAYLRNLGLIGINHTVGITGKYVQPHKIHIAGQCR